MNPEKPILFSTPMVQAILEGRKTVTRRMVLPGNTTDFPVAKSMLNFNIIHDNGGLGVKVGQKVDSHLLWRGQCKWAVGDILYVRETFVYRLKHNRYYYKADHPEFEPYAHDGWKPSIHMPKNAARIWLQVTDVKAERLHDITEEECITEGIESDPIGDGVFKNYLYPKQGKYRFVDAEESFKSLWQSINSSIRKDGLNPRWQANPWVWVVSFKVLSTTGKPAEL